MCRNRKVKATKDVNVKWNTKKRSWDANDSKMKLIGKVLRNYNLIELNSPSSSSSSAITNEFWFNDNYKSWFLYSQVNILSTWGTIRNRRLSKSDLIFFGRLFCIRLVVYCCPSHFSTKLIDVYSEQPLRVAWELNHMSRKIEILSHAKFKSTAQLCKGVVCKLCQLHSTHPLEVLTRRSIRHDIIYKLVKYFKFWAHRIIKL